MPKALVVTDGRPWVASTLSRMREAGCGPLSVVIGAAADDVRREVPGDVTVIENPDWSSGLGSSLRAGLTSASELPQDVDAMLVMLVDLPGVTAAMMTTLMASQDRRNALMQATFGGAPGHPVLLGRNHWGSVAGSAAGDSGARAYLRDAGVEYVELGGAADGADVDEPPVAGRSSGVAD